MTADHTYRAHHSTSLHVRLRSGPALCCHIPRTHLPGETARLAGRLWWLTLCLLLIAWHTHVSMHTHGISITCGGSFRLVAVAPLRPAGLASVERTCQIAPSLSDILQAMDTAHLPASCTTLDRHSRRRDRVTWRCVCRSRGGRQRLSAVATVSCASVLENVPMVRGGCPGCTPAAHGSRGCADGARQGARRLSTLAVNS